MILYMATKSKVSSIPIMGVYAMRRSTSSVGIICWQRNYVPLTNDPAEGALEEMSASNWADS